MKYQRDWRGVGWSHRQPRRKRVEAGPVELTPLIAVADQNEELEEQII